MTLKITRQKTKQTTLVMIGIVLFLLTLVSTMDVCLICTISEKQLLEREQYVIQIDIVPQKNKDDRLNKRKMEGFLPQTDRFFGGDKSHPFIITEKTIVTFDITEALKPMTTLEQGEYTLKCKNFRKEGISRQIHLVPREDNTEYHGAIVFKHDGEFLHRVTISNIPRVKTDGAVASFGNQAEPVLPRPQEHRQWTDGAVASFGNQAEPVLPRPQEHRQWTDGAVASFGNQAEPVLPRPQEHRQWTDDDDDDDDDDNDEYTPSIIISKTERSRLASQSQSTRSSVTSEGLASSSLDEKAIPKVFSNRSLDALAEALGPQDAKRLLTHLDVDDADIKYELANNPRNCSQAYANVFCKWRKDVLHVEGEAFMRQEMNLKLEQIGRNDIKALFMRFSSENCEFSPKDFKGFKG